MNRAIADKQLKAFEGLQDRNWQRLIFNLRKHLDNWAHNNIKPYWGQMKISYMPVICNITVDGITMTELSRLAMISKQNMSRTIRELEDNGMITSVANSNDKRSDILKLTDSGMQFLLEANRDVFNLSNMYKNLVGEKDLETAVNVLNRIIEFHENFGDGNEEHIEG
ncbi:MarR family transcriptional regulator [Mucilaginibacter sp. SMC90]|uniref:MarR family winged helix-turn-helix transcriptional regulator n=1 Tax=Mucilaginibacter sp. SMC90 TaxID=2929803 RepID=UPI001FB277C2|nr:MarR family transcriptional regulator [Mucilaginibacter sp. SMC90]UOE47270.1 MarR family transcriptional regulator [Mucilaginibacter sp. SMC90]